jgi:pimeloyl-ACP methyl ester carboxylesterase
VHDRAARQLCDGRNRALAERLATPLLVPVFPRPAAQPNLYTQALDRDALVTRDPTLRRLDLQLLSMIADARARLRARHVETAAQVLLEGHSAAGMFVSRFVVLHPGAVRGAVVGAPGGWPIVPVAVYKGRLLRYPVGVADLAELVGAPFGAAAFRRVPLFYYLGDRDTNDSVVNDDSFDPVDRALVLALFGATPVQRWPLAAELYRAAGCACELELYPGVDHKPSPQIHDDVARFFQRVLSGPAGRSSR